MFKISTLVDAGTSDTLRLTFANPEVLFAGGRGDIDFSVTASVIPLPAPIFLLIGAVGGLGWISRRRTFVA